jgi:hypothetical protein
MPLDDISLPGLTLSPESMAITPQSFDFSVQALNDDEMLVNIASGTASPKWPQIDDNACVYFISPSFGVANPTADTAAMGIDHHRDPI